MKIVSSTKVSTNDLENIKWNPCDESLPKISKINLLAKNTAIKININKTFCGRTCFQIIFWTLFDFNFRLHTFILYTLRAYNNYRITVKLYAYNGKFYIEDCRNLVYLLFRLVFFSILSSCALDYRISFTLCRLENIVFHGMEPSHFHRSLLNICIGSKIPIWGTYFVEFMFID